ncbi:ring-cleaving dioxygenase [Paenibacillus sp. SC116]|uniref:ring-cleaving dioxygenase n=1 Tax=Paenibacillus sp. SC116 TaxID=2968986 RepID=UPI00215A38B0|nr:ring-cleaving dioxygenase [Paenibacillus sp. SC116]MCR8844659.1 ring-cleaving dioxygenase [Paenibacillus sp. SC116]
MELKGIHHISLLTANAEKNLAFYTDILGMRLVKKTVNQDDTSMYHLFYADAEGNPGTEITFFEIPMATAQQYGINSVSATSLRVASDEALSFWKKRFEALKVSHGEITDRTGRNSLSFTDFEGTRLILVSDEHNHGVAGGLPWTHSDIPSQYGIIGLGPIKLTVRKAQSTINILTSVMGFRHKSTYPSWFDGQPDIIVLETGEGGTGAEVHIEERNDLPMARPGRGAVHHVAFRVDNEEEMHQWVNHIEQHNLPNSGFVDRYYFRSLYFREPNGILYELATDGPGFDTDEAMEHLGESLALPPFLESQREEIEANLKPLRTK